MASRLVDSGLRLCNEIRLERSIEESKITELEEVIEGEAGYEA